jgi:O-antigen/teichoic acid export membrane protein
MDVFFLFLFLPKFGISAYIWSFLITHAVNLWLSLRRLLQVTKYRFPIKELYRPILCLLFSVVLSLILPYKPLRGLYFLLLLGASYTLWDALRPRDRCWLRKVFQASLPKS